LLTGHGKATLRPARLKTKLLGWWCFTEPPPHAEALVQPTVEGEEMAIQTRITTRNGPSPKAINWNAILDAAK
jgi:hypothetical protein